MTKPSSINYFVYFILVIYIFVSCIFLKYPGLNFDELLFEAGTFGRSQNLSEYMPTFRNKPLFLVPYSGSLKGFIFYPIFKLLGVSVFTIRFPLILLSSISFLLIYKSLNKVGNQLFAFLILLLLVTDVVVFSLVRNDVGPSALEFFFKAISLYFLIAIFITKSKLSYLYLTICLALGLYNKLNFIWYINALAGTYFVATVYYCWQKKQITQHIFNIRNLIFGIIFAYSIAFYGYFNNKFKLMRPIDSSAFSFNKIKLSIIEVSDKYFDLFSGKAGDFYSYDSIPSWAAGLAFIVILGVFIGIYDTFQQTTNPKKIFIFSFIIVIFLVIQQITTALLRPFMYIATHINPWHVFMVYPFIIICTCYGYYYGLKKHWLGKLAVSCLIVGKLYFIGILIYNFGTKEPSQDAWSSAIYDLKAATELSEKTVGSVDWGTNSQMHALANGSKKYLDIFAPCCGQFDTKKEKDEFVLKYLSENEKNKIHFVIAVDTVSNYARSTIRDSFYNIINDYNLQIKIEKIILNRENKPIYKLISIK